MKRTLINWAFYALVWLTVQALRIVTAPARFILWLNWKP